MIFVLQYNRYAWVWIHLQYEV